MVVIPVPEVPGDSAVRPDRGLHRAGCHILGVAQCPSGESPSALLDILLTVVAVTHGEEFQEFASEVLVYGSLVVVLIIQPDNHDRVFGKLQEKGVEPVQAEPPEHVDLDGKRAALLRFAETRGEDTVPEKCDLFLQRARGRDHTIQPFGRGRLRNA